MFFCNYKCFINIYLKPMYCVQVILGMFQATGWPGVVSVMANWFGKGRRGLIMGLWNSHTSLGNILLNILVTVATPLERLGANNVMLVSVPNPPLDKKTEEQTPVTFLIRVKTGEDADELKQKISDLCKSE